MSPLRYLDESLKWWGALAPEFAFLLLLPFGLVVIALIGDWFRGRRKHER